MRSFPRNPIRDVLRAMTGKPPPPFVKGYTCYDLTDREWDELHSWAVRNCKPSYLTGIGLIEAAQHQVDEAVGNGNIPAPKDTSDGLMLIQKQLGILDRRYAMLLDDFRRVIKNTRTIMREGKETCPRKTGTPLRSSKKATRSKVPSKRKTRGS